MTKVSKTEQKELLSNGTVEQRKAGEKLMEALVMMLTSPIIGHTEWIEAITEEQKKRIKIERLKQLMTATKEGKKIEMATDFEACVYLMTVSLSQPLGHMWFEIYAYLFRKAYPDNAKEIFDEHEGQKLDIQQEQELANLKKWLYRQQQKANKD